MFPWPAGVVDNMNCSMEQNGFLLMARVGASLVSFLFGCFVVGFFFNPCCLQYLYFLTTNESEE